jgi:hypothetical protein
MVVDHQETMVAEGHLEVLAVEDHQGEVEDNSTPF